MAKELYIYSPIYDFTAETVVKELNGIPENEELTFRLNTPGGNTGSGWSIISKMSERTGKINGVVDGDAMSMGAIMLVFMDNVIANDTSRIMFHKAAYPFWYDPTEDEKKVLKKINSIFREKLTKKINGKPGFQKFIDKVFEADVRNDVEITPKEAKALGIVNEVRKLEPKAYHGMQIVALFEEKQTPKSSGAINNNKKNKSMDLAQLKAEHPALYNELFGLGIEAGVKQEKDRVEAWTVFNEIDPAKVKEGIESGKAPSLKDQSEFSLKAMSKEKLKAMKDENAGETDTPKEEKTEAEIQAEKDEAALKEEMGELKTYE